MLAVLVSSSANCFEASSLLVLVNWFHQKNYPLRAEVGASGSIKCQQIIGGAIPPGSSGRA